MQKAGENYRIGTEAIDQSGHSELQQLLFQDGKALKRALHEQQKLQLHKLP